jgi:Transposase
MEACRQRKQQIACQVSKRPLSAHDAAWLFVCNPRKLKWRQVCWQLEPLRVEDEELGRAYHLAQDFRAMIVHRQAAVLPRWLTEAQQSGIPELRSLAAGIYRDYDAVYGALETSYSNDYVAYCTSFLESRSKHISRPLLTLLERGKETRSSVIVAHPNNAPLAIPMPNGLSRDPMGVRRFFCREHASGP